MSSTTWGGGDHRTTVHVPVLLREAMQFLDLQAGQVVVDGTVGAGGHSRLILERIGHSGTLIGLDRDPMMLQLAASKLSGNNVLLKHANYCEMPNILQSLSSESTLTQPLAQGILLDLGLSSDQLADNDRGFSFESQGPLDLRFDCSTGQPAWKLIKSLDEQGLTEILEQYGEERFSKRIAKQVVSQRVKQPIRTSRDLVAAIRAANPSPSHQKTDARCVSRVFQALRIAVNEELDHLQTAFRDCLFNSLSPGGRIVVISFHSLEDRIVKWAFRGKKRWKTLTPKPVTASPAERRVNPRSRSAKLRAAMKV